MPYSNSLNCDLSHTRAQFMATLITSSNGNSNTINNGKDWPTELLEQISQAQTPILEGKHILLGVTGGIACYKSLELCRLLTKAKAQVRVIMTSGAQAFIQPLSFQALTGFEPHTHLLDSTAEAGMGHIELARWADLVIISPCSANQMARLAQGLAEDLLGTVVLATKSKVVVAPAMNQNMWSHPATQRNIQQLIDDGISVIQPASGEQACGDIGPGRAQEPETLLKHIELLLGGTALDGRKVLITAGPTREAIDPVRFISNHSSGLMGYALARAAALEGAEVTLISGPSHCPWPAGVQGKKVDSADEMLAAASEHTDFDIIIAAAAVADFKPATQSSQKLGKKYLGDQILLQENPDVIAQLVQLNPQAYKVGFAAQTHDLSALAQDKLQRKGLDLICANDVSKPSIGFNSASNEITLFSKRFSQPLTLGPISKELLAQTIISAIYHLN